MQAADLTFPLLLPEKIEGDTIDASGFYRGGRLVHFTYSRMDEFVDGPFGPSSVRTYTQTGALNGDFQRNDRLGRSLGRAWIFQRHLRSIQIRGETLFLKPISAPTRGWITGVSSATMPPMRCEHAFCRAPSRTAFQPSTPRSQSIVSYHTSAGFRRGI